MPLRGPCCVPESADVKAHSKIMVFDTKFVSAATLECRYKGGQVIPVHAAFGGGTPFTGRAFGTVSTADWSGSFKDGVPHGKFSILWNDVAKHSLWFESGTPVEEPRVHASGNEKRNEL